MSNFRDYKDTGLNAIPKNDKEKVMVYSTAIIDAILSDAAHGYEIDFTPFFQRDLDLRAANIIFERTPEEMEIYNRCFNDPLWFIANYAKFETDKGRRVVELRDYQEEIIEAVTDEKYDPESGLFIPVNKSIIINASRQIGKCLFDAEVSIQGDGCQSVISLADLYNGLKSSKRTILGRFKNKLLTWYKTLSPKRFNYIPKSILGRLLQLIESIENRNAIIVEDKFIDFIPTIGDIKVLTDTGYEDTFGIYKTIPYQVYRVNFTDGSFIEGADIHILFDSNLNKALLSDLSKGDLIYSDNGTKEVKSIIKYPFKLSMYDLSVNSENQRYYTSGVLSHNTTTVAAFMAWMLCFKVDKTIGIMANKGATSIEIVDKIIQIFKGLPYFLKPGAVNFGKTGLRLDNGCRIVSAATTKNTSIGFTMEVLYLDEFAHIEESIVNPFWRSVYPTLDASRTSQIIITSTPNGVTNKFFEIWDKAIKQQNNFRPIRVDYWRVPGHDEAWVERTKADFGEEEFAQEFELQFTVNSSMLLKASDLRFMEKIKAEYRAVDLPLLDKEYNDKLLWHPKFNPLSISSRDRFIFSVDLAEGDEVNIGSSAKKDSDYNVINIFRVVPNSKVTMNRRFKNSKNLSDYFRLEQVGLYLDRAFDESAAAEVTKYLMYTLFKSGTDDIDNCRLLLEMNFNGRNFLTILSQHMKFYGDSVISTYHRKPIPGERQVKKMGYKTTSNKEYFCKLGATKIAQRLIIPNQYKVSLPGESTISQLQNFGKGKKGSYRGIGIHDDISMTTLNLSRLYEEDDYIRFLEDYLDYGVSDQDRYNINAMLRRADVENPEEIDALDSVLLSPTGLSIYDAYTEDRVFDPMKLFAE